MTSIAMVMAGPGELPQPEERDVPEPSRDEVIVRVRASSMNYHDLVNLHGLIKGPWPRVPMTDGAGEVVAVGEGVRKLSVGDRVIGAFHPLWLQGPPTAALKRECPGDTSDGWLQQHMRVSADAVVPTPAYLTDVEAATLPCAAVTAWSALRGGNLQPGDVVVAQGTGGVSLFVVQLAKAAGAMVVLTSSSDAKLEIGKSLGADHTINYRTTPDWHTAVRELTGGRGADLVIDVAGPDTLAKSVLATRMGGYVAITGVLSGVGTAEIPLSYAMTRNTRLEGITVGSVADLASLCRAMEVGQIRPHISHTLSWDRLDEAMRLLEANEHVGKIAITIP